MEIPGYYYDHKKRKYFKDTPESKQMRALHLKNTESLELSNRKIIHYRPSHNRIHYLRTREFQLTSNHKDFMLGNIDNTAFQEIDLYIGGCITDLHINTSNDLIIGHSNGWVFSAEFSGRWIAKSIFQLNSGITKIVKLKSDHLIATMGDSNSGGAVYFHSRSSQPKRLFQSRETIWSIAVNPSKDQYSLGSSRIASVIDVRKGTTKFNMKLNTTIFAQAWLTNNLLVNGCRNGKIMIYDIRSRRAVSELQYDAPISRFKIHNEQLYFSTTNGKIRNYDQRGLTFLNLQVQNAINPVEFDLMSDSLLATGDSGYCTLFSLDSQRILDEINISSGIRSLVDFMDDGFWLTSESKLLFHKIKTIQNCVY